MTRLFLALDLVRLHLRRSLLALLLLLLLLLILLLLPLLRLSMIV